MACGQNQGIAFESRNLLVRSLITDSGDSEAEDALEVQEENTEISVEQQHEGPYKDDTGSRALVKRLCGVWIDLFEI
ncbi:hypothetical protein EVAR_53208_1 [Eumeta japonica]|uniref:Uncharacterized protein n=1 Tax=Eumeta variegata TaxID=151549 RepID=A0A4C1XBS8_EUMVA|nr:hypothetical protein EVAR_53208_1 [Eumeta japonica]